MIKLCVFLVCIGVATSALVSQKFKFLDSKLKMEPRRLGSSIILDCETTDASAEVTLWKLKKDKEVQIKPSLNVIQTGEIFTIHNLALDDFGKYICRAQDSMGVKISKDVHVILNSFKPGLVLLPSKPVVAVTGSTVTLKCEAVVGSITWKHIRSLHTTSLHITSNSPKPSKYTIKNTVNDSISLSVLTIPNAQVANSGIYECWLNHYDVTLFRNVDLLVKDLKRPFFNNGNSLPEQKSVKLGHEKHLYCKVNGFPKPVISWEKDGNPISLCSKIFLHTCKGSPYLSQDYGMKIKSARFPEDNGTYTCVAKNRVGTSRKNFNVVVKVKPVLDKSKSLQMKTSTISCHATQGNPSPKFTWLMQFFWFPMTKAPNERAWQQISKYGNTVTLSRDGMTSTIKVPSMITRAFYRCKASNSAGSDTHTTKLFLS